MKIFLKNKRDGFQKIPGGRAFGINWVVESADKKALLKLKPLYEKLRMAEDAKVRVSTALSGSAAYMGRVNPYPSDIDFTEIVMVKASGLKEAANIFVGKLLGITALGFYQMAYRISNMPATEVTQIISEVMFPAKKPPLPLNLNNPPMYPTTVASSLSRSGCPIAPR